MVVPIFLPDSGSSLNKREAWTATIIVILVTFGSAIAKLYFYGPDLLEYDSLVDAFLTIIAVSGFLLLALLGLVTIVGSIVDFVADHFPYAKASKNAEKRAKTEKRVKTIVELSNLKGSNKDKEELITNIMNEIQNQSK